MIVEDGKPHSQKKKDEKTTMKWFEKTYWGDDKYMSKLIYCERVILLNSLVYFTLTHSNTLFICICRFISL